MIPESLTIRAGDSQPPCERGVALAASLLLVVVLTILGLYALGTAVLELRMAANAAGRERAFQAAEFGIEQALQVADLRTSYTLASPKAVPDLGAAPLVPGSPPDTYSYLLYYDTAAGPIPFPPDSARAGLFAYHFVIESTGTSLRGARATLVQGFYVAAPGGSTVLDGLERTRTIWRQTDAE